MGHFGAVGVFCLKGNTGDGRRGRKDQPGHRQVEVCPDICEICGRYVRIC